ncbi:MAG: HAD-IIA family hydrolase [Boseongicola sp.]|nr:HAD-IIA family hydrolase [Boseongicola sp.]
MMTLSRDQAFDAYEAVRHRLPNAVAPARESRHAQSLGDIADDFDVFLLDAFGVLNIGESAIPGAHERVEALRAADKRVLVVSNAASVPSSDLVGKYRRLGFDFAEEDIVTSRAALSASLNGQSGINWGVMAAEGAMFEDFVGLDATLLGDDAAAFDAFDGFLLVGSAGWTEARQSLLEDALTRRPRPVLVGNPDIVAPRETGLSAEPGHFAHRLADRTGVAPMFFGKPFANIFDLAFSRLGEVDKDRVLMVGDSLHTDILGAQTAGVRSALMTGYGLFAGHDVEAAIARTGIVPDFILEQP